MVFAATAMPFKPSVVPAHAADCQLWLGAPGAKHAVRTPIVGPGQPTAPASVGPAPPPVADIGRAAAGLARGIGHERIDQRNGFGRGRPAEHGLADLPRELLFL